MIKAVIFDYGEVMKVSFPLAELISEIFNIPTEEVAAKKDLITPLHRVFEKGQMQEKEFWEKISLILKRPALENFKEISRKVYGGNFHLRKEMQDFVKKLKKDGFKTAVLSDVSDFAIDVIRENNGYDGFDVEVLSCVERMIKPDSNIYELTIKRLGVKPDECVFIDDKEINLSAAKNLGIKTVLFKNSEQSIRDILQIINSEK